MKELYRFMQECAKTFARMCKAHGIESSSVQDSGGSTGRNGI